MRCIPPLLLFALAACTTGPAPLPPPDAEVRPVTASDVLDGTWRIVAVNGETYDGRLTFADRTVTMRLCNLGTASFSRNGDKLSFGAPWAMTEMACVDPLRPGRDREAEALAVLRLTMTMELTPPDRLRLVNEAGTIDLVIAGG